MNSCKSSKNRKPNSPFSVQVTAVYTYVLLFHEVSVVRFHSEIYQFLTNTKYVHNGLVLFRHHFSKKCFFFFQLDFRTEFLIYFFTGLILRLCTYVHTAKVHSNNQQFVCIYMHVLFKFIESRY